MLRRSDIKTTIRYLYKKVSNFLSKAQSRELLTFLFFLSLSFLFWVLQSMNEEGEANFSVPVTYTNIPEQVVITNVLPDHIGMRLRDKGIILLNYSFSNKFQPIQIDFKKYQNKKGVIQIRNEQLMALLKKQLNIGSSVVSLSPDTLSIYYSEQKGKKIPVLLQSDISSAPQAQIGKPFRISPDSVLIYAPREMLDTIHDISTQKLVLTNLTDTVTTRVSLLQEYGSKVIPSQVEVTIPVEEYTEKRMSLPLELLGVPDSLTLRTFPGTVQLSCFVGLNAFRDIFPELFEVAIDYNEIRQAQGNKVPVKIMRAPDNVTNIRVNPDSVEFILEQKDIND